MNSMTVKLTWDEDLGPNWLNEDNLALLLYNSMATRSDLVQIQVVDHTERHGKVPKSLEEIARLVQNKIQSDQIKIDQFGFSLDVVAY